MPEQMTKQDAIEYLLYMKHNVQAKSPMDIALDIAIEALKPVPIRTNADRIRHMTDDDLGDFLINITNCCGNYSSSNDCESCYMFQRRDECDPCEWLRKDVDEDADY